MLSPRPPYPTGRGEENVSPEPMTSHSLCSPDPYCGLRLDRCPVSIVATEENGATRGREASRGFAVKVHCRALLENSVLQSC